VSIRDGAYSRFDRSNVVEEFTPTQGLKGFLSKYVDESAVYRRRSQSEDDNPPSPIVMDDPPSGPNSVGSSFLSSSNIRAPQSPRDAGLRFAPHPLTPPSGSNPHTPASPHPIGQNHPNFNMTSPPAPHMPHPSPGAGIMPPSSPLNAQPSPMAHSPNPNSLGYMQSHPEGSSPFTSLSPAASNWPGSPGIPRPSPRPGQSPDHRTQRKCLI
jgi:mediator of RNA polymerase II transcription subunit 14